MNTNGQIEPDRVGSAGSSALDRLGKVLDTPPKVMALYVVSLVILGTGLAMNPAKYSDTDFAAKYLWTELILTVLFAGVSFLMLQPSQIGLRPPQLKASIWVLAPIAAVVVVGISTGLTWASLPDGANVDTSILFQTFLTTMLVGFTEEWMYRGLLLVVFTRLLGFNRGVVLAAVAFGLLHALNVLGGQSTPAVAGQVGNTTLLGFMFIGLVIATRSLWLAIVLHGLYDFFLFADGLFVDAGATKSPITLLGVAIFLITAIGFILTLRKRATAEIFEPEML